MPSIRPLVPAARGLELQTLTPRTLAQRALSGGVRRASTSSPPPPPLGAGSADTYRRRSSSRAASSSQQEQQQQQQQQQHPLTGYSLRVSSRQGRADGGRAGGRRLAGGGRDSWRAAAVAFNAVESRTRRETTALRAVSARLEAASTAIDAVEIGVRSASDSLDSLLQLLESRPEIAVSTSSLSPAATAVGVGVHNQLADRGPPSPRGGGRELERLAAAPSGLRALADTVSTSSQRRSMSPPSVVSAASESMAGTSTGEPPSGELNVPTSRPQPTGRAGQADREGGGIDFARAAQGGGGSRAANMLRRELEAGPTPVSHPEAGEYRRRSTAVSPRQNVGARENSVAIRDISSGETKEDRSTLTTSGESSISSLKIPRLVPLSAAQEDAEEAMSGSNVEERERSSRHDLSTLASSGRRGVEAEGLAPVAGPGPRIDNADRATVPASITGPAALGQLGNNSAPSLENGPRSTRVVGSRRVSPRGTAGMDSSTARSLNELDVSANPDRGDVSLPVLELEAAMDGIDTERGRLILEIARLRGQQNQSLVHLQRLQHEQFVVRQRQVSTLSDIVNSFGRTVAAAGALPHGENSSLGRISSDVVSTLRRMLRLLSATVPAATAAYSTLDDSSMLTTTSALGDALPSGASRPPTARERQAAMSPAGAYSAGELVALQPVGVDLTQEVIDAALQALPRLAAAATAISGARRMQGYLADLAGGHAGDAEGLAGDGTGRCCTKETIAALPDAPPSTGGDVGDIGGGGGGVSGCVICLSESSTAGQLLCYLPCNHVFHRVCVGKWLRMQDSCPTCRRQVPNVETGSNAAAMTPSREVV